MLLFKIICYIFLIVEAIAYNLITPIIDLFTGKSPSFIYWIKLDLRNCVVVTHFKIAFNFSGIETFKQATIYRH